MKKILAMLLALACVLSFAACASKKTDDTIGAESPSTSEQQTQTHDLRSACRLRQQRFPGGRR